MFFLLRTAFWLSVVLVLLPTGAGTPATTGKVGAADALTFATATVSDMTQFCERQPEACVAGANAAVTFGQRTLAGARMVYEFLNDRLATGETGSVTKPAAAPADRPTEIGGRPSQHTLKSSDIAVPWRLPQPRPAGAPKDPA